MRTNPDLALSQLPATLRTLEEAYFKRDPSVPRLAGGFPESVTWAVYNSIGSVFPSLPRGVKDTAIRQTLSLMDRQCHEIVNGQIGLGHTTGIREPLYLGELCTVRWRYWPGLDEGRYLIKQNDGSFHRIRTNLMAANGEFYPAAVHSDFLVAYAFLRNDLSTFGDRFAEACERGFMDRTITAIAKLSVFQAKTAEGAQRDLDRIKRFLPKSLHDRVESASKTEDWIGQTVPLAVER